MGNDTRTTEALTGPKLNEPHRKTLCEGSGISPEVIAERCVRSVEKGRAGQGLPKAYSRRQKARGNGILFTVHRPNGETATIFRPDEPDPESPGHKYEQECKHYGGPGNVLDVPPSLHRLIENTGVPVVFVEGIKKADAITTAARKIGMELLVVAISGVWNWMSDGEPIPDMFDVPVGDRRVLICFDSDMLRKPEVQMAAERLADHLKQRGARVEVVYLPDQPDGSKTGPDDFLASEAGGTLEELLALARPYSPGDLQTEKFARNPSLREAHDYLWNLGDQMPTNTDAQCSRRSAWRACVRILEKHGVLWGDGVAAIIPTLDGAANAHMSQPAFSKYLKSFAEEGEARRIVPERRELADTYVFLVPGRALRYNNGTERGGEGEEQRGNDTHSTEVHPGYNVPRALPEVRWSTPGPRKQKRGVVPGTRKPRQGIPSGEAEPKRRPGKRRDEIVRYLADNSGAASKAELLARFGSGKTRWRDFKRRILSELLGYRRQCQDTPLTVGPPVIELAGDGVRLVEGWQEAWAKHRILSGEKEAEEKQARENVRQRIAYRRRMETPADRAPTEEEMAEGREARQKRRKIERLVDEGMSRRFAAEAVLGADGFVEDLSPVEDPDPPPEPREHPLACECLGCSATVPSYVRMA